MSKLSKASEFTVDDEGSTTLEQDSEEHIRLADVGQASLLGLVVFISRYLTKGPVYYVDGPILVRCILDRTYVIQPPGYWLFARLGGLFGDPAFGLQFLNETFSALGAVVFFLLCRKLGLGKGMAWVASVCYESIFFVWLAGDIHSSYASQILFPPLLVLLFLLYGKRKTTPRLIACGACFAIGTGLRPSDGGFLILLFAILIVKFVHGLRNRALVVATAVCGCLGWYLPGQAASRAAHIVPMESYIEIVRPMSLLLSGVQPRAIGNTVRVVLPLSAAFWMLIPTLSLKRERFENCILAAWIAPGMLFYLLIYMADPVYFTYLTAAIVLLTALSRPRILAFRMMVLCAVFNTSLFLFARPLTGNGRVTQAINFYIVKYCEYGIKHQWTSTIGRGGIVP